MENVSQYRLSSNLCGPNSYYRSPSESCLNTASAVTFVVVKAGYKLKKYESQYRLSSNLCGLLI